MNAYTIQLCIHWLLQLPNYSHQVPGLHLPLIRACTFNTWYLSLVAIQNSITYAKFPALFAVCQVSLSALFPSSLEETRLPNRTPALTLKITISRPRLL